MRSTAVESGTWPRAPALVGARVYDPGPSRYADAPITELHVVGGVNPKLPYAYYLELLRAIKAARPEAHGRRPAQGNEVMAGSMRHG